MADMPSKGQSPYGPTVKAYIDNGDAGVASDLEDHEDSTTAVHGIPDTSLLETQAGAQAKANSAKSGAEGTAAANLTAHVTKASDAHAASAISYAGGPLLPPGTVEGALDTLDSRTAGSAAILNSGTNLNDVIVSGRYAVGHAHAAESGSNAPVALGGWLIVNAYAATLQQTYTPFDATNQRMYVRQTSGGVWQAWQEMAAIGAAVPGGTIVGTGMPNGVVSAPVGTRYVDTAATNGAREWYKDSGGGNTGWVVTNGDTGWRRVAGEGSGWDLDPEWAWGTGAGFSIRRINSIVHIRIVGTMTFTGPQGAGKTPFGTTPIPQGFSPYYVMVPMRLMNPFGTIGYFGSMGTSHFTADCPAGTTTFAYATASYPVALTAAQAAWPSTLPGTPLST